MTNLQWVHQHVSPDFFTTIFIMIGFAMFLYATLSHSKQNKKIIHIVIAILLLTVGASASTNLEWNNAYYSFKKRADMHRLIMVRGVIYDVAIDDSKNSRIVLNKINVYNDAYKKKFIETYGSIGTANDVINVTPKYEYKEPSLDCSTK